MSRPRSTPPRLPESWESLESSSPRVAQVLRQFVPRTNPWIPIQPHPKQAAFLLLDHILEVLYGGAAGGGKTEALLTAATQYVDVPGYRALLSRRTYPQLAQPGGLMDKAAEWFQPTAAKWNHERKRWTFPSGATITFASMQYETDMYQFQSSELGFIGLDEATHFTEKMALYLLSRLRNAPKGVPLRFRLATNPGGIGHEWVYDRYVDPETRTARCAFVPAVFTDNPHNDPEYGEQLDQLDDVERARLKFGDWSATSGGQVFQREWFEIVPACPPDITRRVRGWDAAATQGGGDATASARWARSEAGVFYVEDLTADHLATGERDKLIVTTARADGEVVEVAWEEEPGSSGKDASFYRTRDLAGFITHADRPTGPKVVRAGAWASQAKAGLVKLVRGPWNRHFLAAVQRFPEAYKDEIDACSVAFNRLARGSETLIGRGPTSSTEPRKPPRIRRERIFR